MEFQKRGLPHIHLLVIVEEADKPRTPDIVDRCVTADVPDRDQDLELDHLVDSHGARAMRRARPHVPVHGRRGRAETVLQVLPQGAP